MLLFTLQLEALEITPTSPLVPYINWLYPRTQAESGATMVNLFAKAGITLRHSGPAICFIRV